MSKQAMRRAPRYPIAAALMKLMAFASGVAGEASCRLGIARGETGAGSAGARGTYDEVECSWHRGCHPYDR